MSTIIELIFSLGLFLNAFLFIPQAFKIYREKSAIGVSLLTFSGFLVIQLAIILHGIIHKDYLLIMGYLLSIITCGSVVVLTLKYKNDKNSTLINKLGSESNSNERIEMLENILALMPGHVYWVNRENAYLGCNNNQAKSAGLKSRDEIVGKHNKDLPWNFNAGSLPEALDEINNKVMITGKSIQIEEPAIMSDNTKIMFLSNKVPIYNKSGNIIGMVGISIDITDRIKAEEREKIALAEAASANTKARIEEEIRQAVMILAGSIAHDLRTPLATVKLMSKGVRENLPVLIEAYKRAQEANIVLSKTITRPHFMSLEKIPDSLEGIVDEMNIFINDNLKSLSRVVSGTLTQDDLVKCSIDHCIQNTLQRYPFDGNEKDLVHWDRNYEFDFQGNPVLFFRVLFNLIKNALYQIHKNHQGEIFISTEDGGEFNLLKVKDTAGGASPETINNLFEGYKTTKKEGTGIGLAFCKLTIKSFGGDISCHSPEKNAIEFVLRFPKHN